MGQQVVATLELCHIDKGFPGTRALKDVSLTVQPGRVHALVGENGAGKSTLIKIASGALQPDAGSILLRGEPVTLNPQSARHLGIRVVHQERQVAMTRTVAQNLVLDAPERNRLGLVTRRSIAAEARRRLDRVGVDLDLDAPVWSLTVAQTQMLEIARAVDFHASCIIMDEPTASLHRSEIGTLFSVIRAVKDSGIAIVYISHHLDEVMELADDYTVLRDGRRITTGQAADTTTARLVTDMFGAETTLRREDLVADPPAPGGVAVELAGVSFGTAVTDVSLTVRYGEVVVVTGAVGSGAGHVGRLVAGAITPTAGRVLAAGRPVRSRAAAARAGVALLPADRKRQALMLDRSVAENVMIAEHSLARRRLAVPIGAIRRAARSCRTLSVKTSDVRNPVRTLSGGNQQRVVLARWLTVGSTIMVLDEPTVGVDIPSKLAIYDIVRRRAESGAAVLVLSTEYSEIRCVADRVVVMRDGRVVGELPGADATESAIFELELGSRT
jgi:ABC-type sugar transport system ATPase subunit